MALINRHIYIFHPLLQIKHAYVLLSVVAPAIYLGLGLCCAVVWSAQSVCPSFWCMGPMHRAAKLFFRLCIAVVKTDTNKWIMGADKGRLRHIGFWSGEIKAADTQRTQRWTVWKKWPQWFHPRAAVRRGCVLCSWKICVLLEKNKQISLPLNASTVISSPPRRCFTIVN